MVRKYNIVTLLRSVNVCLNKRNCFSSLRKEVEKRPHYPELLQHPLIKEYESKPVDVGVWFQDICKTIGPL